MKLITLNIWGGRVFEPLIDFFRKMSVETDIFCLQEVFKGTTDDLLWEEGRANIYCHIAGALPDFDGYFAALEDEIDDKPPRGLKVPYGLATFIKKSVPVSLTGETFVYKYKNCMKDSDGNHGRALQYIKFSDGISGFTVANLHGVWLPGLGKDDFPDRIKQSKNVRACLDQIEGKKILCGDFNLNPETKSLAILEEGMRNLIKEYGITSTRSGYYHKPKGFADYILVSTDINVKDFRVLQDQVSDHLPLLLEFD